MNSFGFRISLWPGKLCYTDNMHEYEEEAFWPTWAQFLHDKGATEFVAALLEGAAPLRIIAAQLMYAGTPFLGSRPAVQKWRAFANLLEDPVKTASFVSFLRGEENR